MKTMLGLSGLLAVAGWLLIASKTAATTIARQRDGWLRTSVNRSNENMVIPFNRLPWSGLRIVEICPRE
jgi:hypothetical protein